MPVPGEVVHPHETNEQLSISYASPEGDDELSEQSGSESYDNGAESYGEYSDVNSDSGYSQAS